MLELIKDLPPHVIGVRATGKVTAHDLEEVVMPAVDRLVATTDKIHYLLVLENDIGDWSLGAFASDAGMGLKYFSKWSRIAVVSDQKNVRQFTDLFSSMVPGESKGYAPGELEQAKAWVSQEDR